MLVVSAAKDETLRFEVKVTPRAKRSAVTGVIEGRLSVTLVAPPVEGAANEALVIFLAKSLGLKKRQVRIVRGEKARIKLVEIPAAAEPGLRKLVS